jgi:hypothetical protein
MMHGKPLRALLAVTCVLLLGIGAWLWSTRRRQTEPSAPSLETAIARKLPLLNESTDRFSTRRSYRAGDEEIEIEIIKGLDADAAKLMIDDGVMGIHALYADALSAYPEALSRQVKTPERFQPVVTRKEVRGVPCTLLTLYATERRAYGALSDDTVKLRSLLGWIYQANEQTLYKIRIFAPLTTSPLRLEERFESLLTP